MTISYLFAVSLMAMMIILTGTAVKLAIISVDGYFSKIVVGGRPAYGRFSTTLTSGLQSAGLFKKRYT